MIRLHFDNLLNYDNIQLIKETDMNQSQISLLPRLVTLHKIFYTQLMVNQYNH